MKFEPVIVLFEIWCLLCNGLWTGPMDQWATGSTGWHGSIFGPRTVPGPSSRHGGLFRHGPAGQKGLARAQAVPARCSSLVAPLPLHPPQSQFSRDLRDPPTCDISSNLVVSHASCAQRNHPTPLRPPQSTASREIHLAPIQPIPATSAAARDGVRRPADLPPPPGPR